MLNIGEPILGTVIYFAAEFLFFLNTYGELSEDWFDNVSNSIFLVWAKKTFFLY